MIGIGFVKCVHVWTLRWPLERGKYIPFRMLPLMRKLGAVPVRMEFEPGVVLLLDPQDYIQRLMVIERGWQVELFQSIQDGLKDGSVFMDVGANIGYDSIRASRRVGKTGLVIAFEPSPVALRQFRANLEASRVGNVIVQPVACTDREQTLTLYEGGMSELASLSRRNAGGGDHVDTFTVQGRPIDNVVRDLKLERIDVIKIDVEGAEAAVLKGAMQTLSRFHPRLIVEIIPEKLAEMGAKPEDVLSLIKEAGYGDSRQIDDTDWEWIYKRP